MHKNTSSEIKKKTEDEEDVPASENHLNLSFQTYTRH
jgi:hypothetical protein